MIKRWLLVLTIVCSVPHYSFAEVGTPDAWDEPASEEIEFQGEQLVSGVSVVPAADDKQVPLAKDDVTKVDVSSQLNLINRIQGLQQELAELRGRMDEQTQLIQHLQEQQLALYKDLDARVALQMSDTHSDKSKTQLAGNNDKAVIVPAAIVQQIKPIRTTPTLLPNNNNKNPADEQVSYLSAYELIKNKQYPEALKAMQAFVQKYPKSGYLANAHYWLGELYLLQNNHTQAMNHFEWVLHQYPQSSKCSASLLKLGYMLAANGKIDAAKTHLHKVVNKYPDTHAAQMARVKLDALGG